MDSPVSTRRARRSVNPKNYEESPIESPSVRKSTRKSLFKQDENAGAKPKTPKSARKSVGRVLQDNEDVSPKKLRRVRTPSTKALESIVLESSPTIDKLNSPPTRRSKRATSNVSSHSEKKQRKASSKAVSPAPSSSDTSDSELEPEIKIKPTTLFDDAEDVVGDILYPLRTPKKKDSMALLAQHTPKTPRHNDPSKGTPRTPKNNRLSELQKTPTSRPSASKLAKTPRHVRVAVKKSENSITI